MTMRLKFLGQNPPAIKNVKIVSDTKITARITTGPEHAGRTYDVAVVDDHGWPSEKRTLRVKGTSPPPSPGLVIRLSPETVQRGSDVVVTINPTSGTLSMTTGQLIDVTGGGIDASGALVSRSSFPPKIRVSKTNWGPPGRKLKWRNGPNAESNVVELKIK